MLVSGRMIKWMDMVYMCMQISQNMKGNGKRIRGMAKVRKCGQMILLFMREIS
jgi:hypothetical protein